jgi:hypothetical protein
MIEPTSKKQAVSNDEPAALQVTVPIAGYKLPLPDQPPSKKACESQAFS